MRLGSDDGVTSQCKLRLVALINETMAEVDDKKKTTLLLLLKV